LTAAANNAANEKMWQQRQDRLIIQHHQYHYPGSQQGSPDGMEIDDITNKKKRKK
jgi:hypothetical protein